MRFTLSVLVGTTCLSTFCTWLAAPVAAQTSNFGPFPPDATERRAPGWTFTPALVLSSSWDDNVLLRGQGDSPVSDVTNVVNPRASMSLNGRYTQIDASYDGAFLLYRQFNTLNSYDQRASLSVRRLVTPHVALFVSDSLTVAPTTEAVELVGLPFVRTGSRIDDARGGVEVTLSPRTSFTASYTFQWVRFDQRADLAAQLLGGHSQGGTASWRHALTARTALIADYDLQRATVIQGADSFNVQTGSVGIEQRLSDLVQVFGAIGVSRLGLNAFGPPRTGPAWRLGVLRQFRGAAGVDVTYSRSFVPSYGFGGTVQNEELVGRLRVPLARRVGSQASVSWRSNQPLVSADPNLKSLWIEANVGYAMRPWLRLEGFYANARQTIDRPGGRLNDNRVGLQIVTSNPLRVR
jgi:hypothetical protein